jgi:DNA polymerase
MMTTRFQLHRDKWRDCDLCQLCNVRTKVVIARGSVPADVLFVGEAPGASEDVVGSPFVGPAGRLLDHIIEAAIEEQHSWAMTNLVCCIPKDLGGDKGEPPKESILACRPRLMEFMELCRPRLIICVGQLSKRWTPEVDDIPKASILHPAAILRMDAGQRPLAIKRCVVAVSDAVATYL